jgi:hypothetical protein
VVEGFFLKMQFKVLPQHFNLTPKVVVGTFNQLELALVFVMLEVLPQDPSPTLVVTVNLLKQTAFFVHIHISGSND